jgi:uncharacterized membrane protein YfcA
MIAIKLVLAAIVGIVSGIIGGALGIGGTLMLPGIILLDVVPNFKTAVGTILFTFLPPITLLAVLEYRKHHQVDYVVGTVLFISYFFAAYYGSIINNKFDDKTLQNASGITFLMISMYFFYNAYKIK